MRIFTTTHSTERMQQRGVRASEAELVALEYDRKIHLNSGLTALSISKSRAQKLRPVFGDKVMSRVESLTLLVDYQAGVIVTAVKGAHYRDGQSRHRRGGSRNTGSWCANPVHV